MTRRQEPDTWLEFAPLEATRREQFDAVSHVTFAGPFETITPWEWDWFE